jgi:tight adherence protein B
MTDLQQFIQTVLAASTFALVLSLWIGGVLLWAGRRASREGKVRRRMGIGEGSIGQKVLHLWHEGRDFTTTVSVREAGNSWVRRQERELVRAEIPLTIWQALALVSGIVMITLAFLVVVVGNVMLAIGVAIGFVIILKFYVGFRVMRREAVFETQLVDALELAARSLRAGHPLMGAFQLLSEEMSPPVSNVFAEICQRHGMGADLEQVLRDAGEESASDDMKLFATSVAIQIRTGGNLADLMERLAAVIRDRIRVHRRARVLTAQTQMSKRVLIALPFILFILLNIINPDYMSPFMKETAAQVMLAIGIGLLIIGSWLMNKLAVIKY